MKNEAKLHLPFDARLTRHAVATFLHAMLVCLASVMPAVAQPSLPSLGIVSSNDSVSVSWPQTGYYFILQTATDPFGAGNWTNVATASEMVSSLESNDPEGSSDIATNVVEEAFVTDVPIVGEQQFFRLKSPPPIPVFQFAIFYNGLLEFSSTADLTINGLVHANGPVYVGAGTASQLIFEDVVTSGVTLFAPTNNSQSWGDPYTHTASWRTTFNGSPSYVTNCPNLGLSIASSNLHSIIEMPPVGEDPNSEIWKSRLFNQAHIVLLVSNTTVTLGIRESTPTTEQEFMPGNDPSPVILRYSFAAARTNFPFVTLTNTFYENREIKTNRVTQVDVGSYARWIETNAFVLMKFPVESGRYPTILYVADCRTNNARSMCSVRLVNGLALPINGRRGFTLATPNPLYVWGNYNCTNPAAFQTSDTSHSVPAALMADAITILSTNWSDATSFLPFSRTASYWLATNTTVNAAMLAGIVPTRGASSSDFSGGAHNFPRLLENWQGSTLWLNTSIACLYNSKVATNRFLGTWVYYVPPARQFRWNTNFSNASSLPPGTPYVSVMPPLSHD